MANPSPTTPLSDTAAAFVEARGRASFAQHLGLRGAIQVATARVTDHTVS